MINDNRTGIFFAPKILEQLSRELTSVLVNNGIPTVNKSGCLCDTVLDDDIAVVVGHPHYNDTDCLKRMKQVVQEHPDTRFYMMLFHGPSDSEYLGRPPNVTYIDIFNDDFFSNPARRIRNDGHGTSQGYSHAV